MGRSDGVGGRAHGEGHGRRGSANSRHPDRIGQNANQSVFATLICEAAAPFVERSTATMVFRSNRTAIFESTIR